MDGTAVAALNKLAQSIANAPTEHIVERSFFTTPLNARGRPIRRPVSSLRIDLKSIQISVNSSPEEALLFGKSMLKSDEIEVVTSWLYKNYSLAALQRASVQVVQELEIEQENNPGLIDALEQRALVVAEATSRRAVDEAAKDDGGDGGHLRRVRTRGLARPRVNNEEKRRKKTELLSEKDTLEETLASFNSKIAMFAVEDPATAEMLMPAKLDLEGKLRHVLAQLASCGVASEEAKKEVPWAASPTGVGHAGPFEEVPERVEFVPQPLEYMDEDSSSEDERDLRMALPIDGSEYDMPLKTCMSGRDDYISSCDEEDGTKFKKVGTAQFVIDLSGARSKGLGEDSDFGEISLKEEQGLVEEKLDEMSTINIPTSPVVKSDFMQRRTESPRSQGYDSDLETRTPRGKRQPRNTWYESGASKTP